MENSKEDIGSQTTVGNWQQKDIQVIYEELEHPNWAPWLEAQPESLAGRAKIFPKGQLLLKDNAGNFLASLSMNRIQWNGDKDSLLSWDDVAGNPTTYEKTYVPSGNTLTLMSMNVNPKNTGEGYARILIEKARLLAIELNVDYLIGSYRPNEYGKFKLSNLDKPHNFEHYCVIKRNDGLPIDSWLRNLTRNGMQPLKVDHKAMVVPVSLQEFARYQKEYNPEKWVEISPNIWECGEVGTWKVDAKNGLAVYKESNLWGISWKKTGSR